jgi:predicted ArsR family transcriptional regulator
VTCCAAADPGRRKSAIPAETLDLVPGGVRHHLRALEAAGLIRRTRVGRHVEVELTARGRALQMLFPRVPGSIGAA